MTLMTPPTRLIAVLARAPVPGSAKTRLIPRLGAAGAAALQAHLLEATLAKAHRVADAAVRLWVAGPLEALPAAARAEVCAPQQGDDLGARMAHAIRVGLREAKQVAVIGTDAPALTADDIAAAFAALATHDVALVPADDGGYVLLATARDVPQLFADIAWGSAQVLDATIARAAQAGLSLARLPARPDLDTPEDYTRARAAGWLDGYRA